MTPGVWVTRILLHGLLRHMRRGAFRIVYWDGTEEQIGNGTPHFCLRFERPPGFLSLLRSVELGLAEAFMDGRIEMDDLTAVLELGALLCSGEPSRRPRRPLRQRAAIHRQYRDVQHHYDRGNEFFALWLDASRTYSCAYFETPDATLEEAQRAKRRHILRKLQLQPGQKLLEIGCGWGALLFDAAQEHGVLAHGITLSEQQYEFVRQRVCELGLEERVRVDLAHYREFAGEGEYDRIVSVGMFEHVGRRHLRAYLDAVARLLKPDGLSLLHTITRREERAVTPWITRYIFPGESYIPSWRETIWLLPEFHFELLDVENLRPHYALTLDRWAERFEARLPEVRALGYDERFIRMWRLYLRGCAAAFRHHHLTVHQFLFSRGRPEGLPLTRAHLYTP